MESPPSSLLVAPRVCVGVRLGDARHVRQTLPGQALRRAAQDAA